MFIAELFDGRLQGHRTEKDDQSIMHLSDMRKGSRITFAGLNKLRMANDIRKFEHEDKLKKVATQYKAAAPAGGRWAAE